MSSKQLGEMFEGDSADTCVGKFRSCQWGAEQRVLLAQTRQRGPPSACVEFFRLETGIATAEASEGGVLFFFTAIQLSVMKSKKKQL
jgi:hypothetical protein